jgi:diketogulonate reductase-like aldo/keto reductase
VKQQLAWLQVEYLDLYLIHTPRSIKDGLTFIGVWQELEKLVDQGLVRSLGVSNLWVLESLLSWDATADYIFLVAFPSTLCSSSTRPASSQP